MIAWRIYYADGSTFSDRDGRVEDAPGWGVIIIAQQDMTPQPYNIGRLYRFGKDFYCWELGRGWTGRDSNGREFYLAEPGWKKIVNGIDVAADAFHRIKANAETDDYLPPRNTANEAIDG